MLLASSFRPPLITASFPMYVGLGTKFELGTGFGLGSRFGLSLDWALGGKGGGGGSRDHCVNFGSPPPPSLLAYLALYCGCVRGPVCAGLI